MLYCCANILTSLLEADLVSFFDSVYVRPVLVRGSTIVKTLPIAIVTRCSIDGYLKEFDGPGGCSNVNLT